MKYFLIRRGDVDTVMTETIIPATDKAEAEDVVLAWLEVSAMPLEDYLIKQLGVAQDKNVTPDDEL